MRTIYRKWSEYPYPGEQTPPQGSPEAAYWPMFFFSRDRGNIFLDPFHHPVNWNIKNPIDIDWNTELAFVEKTLKSLTPEQIRLARYWGIVDINKRLSSVVFRQLSLVLLISTGLDLPMRQEC